jgi:hypothetical protein
VEHLYQDYRWAKIAGDRLCGHGQAAIPVEQSEVFENNRAEHRNRTNNDYKRFLPHLRFRVEAVVEAEANILRRSQ